MNLISVSNTSKQTGNFGRIINECKLENENLHGNLTVQADIEKQRLLQIE